MCGIVGSYQQPDGERLVRTMSARLAHRGPDAHGLVGVEDGPANTWLAQRRLSIIDLTAASDQPMTKDGWTLVYNGELYNYRELRHQLDALGVRFRTGSDTEVVLEAWRTWGPAALSRFRGMFAFALLEHATGELVLARDPLGIKPLHVVRRGRGWLFASELKAIVTVMSDSLTLDPAAMVASMLYYWVPDNQCSYREVRKLPPGSWARISPDGSLDEHVYWDPVAVAHAAREAKPAHLRQVIEDSVTAHLVSDVPVSTFLSGGLDSSLVTALAARTTAQLDAYTISFRGQDTRLEATPDDARYARTLAQQLGITLHDIEIAPDIVSLLPRLVDILDEPVGDPAAINTLLMCEAARDRGNKVLLSGMGADEMFGGYRKHAACLLADRAQQLPAWVLPSAARVVGPLPVTTRGRGLRHVRWAKRFLDFAALPEEQRFRRSYTMYDQDELVALLNPDLAASVGTVIAHHTALYSSGGLDDHVNRMCLADCRMFLPGLNLMYTDRASMAASTEVRTPFVDPDVFAAAFTFSGGQKIRRGKGKLPLKQAARGIVPDEIIDRPKASFSAPLRAWVSRDLRELVDDTLLRGTLIGDGVIDQRGVARMVASDRVGHKDYSKQIWQLLTLETWYRHNSTGVSTASVSADDRAFSVSIR